MSIEKEIERAVKRTIALDKDTPYKSAAEQEKIISDIKSAFNDATFHFENSKSLMLNQSGKKRLVKQYDNLYSPENILCQSNSDAVQCSLCCNSNVGFYNCKI